MFKQSFMPNYNKKTVSFCYEMNTHVKQKRPCFYASLIGVIL